MSPCTTFSLPTTICSSPSTNHFGSILSRNRSPSATPAMIDVLHNQPIDTKPSPVPIHDDTDTCSEPTVTSSALEGDSTGFSFRSVDSGRRGVNSYPSSVYREFILKDVHGRVINNASQVKTSLFLRLSRCSRIRCYYGFISFQVSAARRTGDCR